MRKKSKSNLQNEGLSKYERSIEGALDVKSLKAPTARLQQELKSTAKRTLKELKAARTNIRMDPRDMLAIRDLAQQAGIPYQTFIAHVLHLYVTGRLLNVDEIKKLVASGVLNQNTKAG